MKIVIKPPHWHPFALWLPLKAIRWNVTKKAMRHSDFHLDVDLLYKAIQEEKRRYGKLLLVEASSRDGAKVKIYL